MFQNISKLKEEIGQLRNEIKDANNGGMWETVKAIGSIVAGGIVGGTAGAVAAAGAGAAVRK